ncbi:TPR/MLP1/MLP2-like protein-domain-containing protein [Amylostereum chailletii]|nr:TPR/MLP1/MLP2-like protein-domain-containing protein [Amylostereum chailletii]
MHNDLERSGENDRRRLESQIQMLETQSQDLRKQLSEERDNVETLSSTREALVKAETSQNHLEERVESLSRQLQGNEEKLAVYERRGTTVGVTHTVGGDDMSKEQQFEAEVAELRSSLKVAQVDLSNARNNVQQFQEISQANEAALSTLNATYDDYKRTTEAQLSQLDVSPRLEFQFQSDNDALQDDLKRVEEELAKSKEALTEIQRSFEVEREAWLNDKKTLEDTIVDLTTSEKAIAEDRTSRESAVQQQEERVKAAEERYTREVVAHAESIKAIEDLKQQINGLQTSARTNLAAAETAQAKLVSSEASWSHQRATLDKELADVTSRCKELAEQNKVLHQHLETVSSQAAKIRQAADASTASGGESQPADEADAKLSELRAVIGYLRREKDIVEMQLELSKQESTRLKTQITHLTRDLDETRTTLSEERERAVAAAATDAQHAELLDKISQLTLLRESNATLRADSEANAKRARELDAQVKSLTTELEPLRSQVRNLRAELQSTGSHVKRLEDESRRWQERNAQLLSKVCGRFALI